MKTMKDFLGTQGEISYEYPFINSDQLFVVVKGIPTLYVAEVRAPDTFTKQEAEANARLFAGSKKLLEAAIEVVKAQQNWALNVHDKKVLMDKLEQAINEAL